MPFCCIMGNGGSSAFGARVKIRATSQTLLLQFGPQAKKLSNFVETNMEYVLRGLHMAVKQYYALKMSFVRSQTHLSRSFLLMMVFM